jgi:hypothetical protein
MDEGLERQAIALRTAAPQQFLVGQPGHGGTPAGGGGTVLSGATARFVQIHA